jgi:hypothetical protein
MIKQNNFGQFIIRNRKPNNVINDRNSYGKKKHKKMTKLEYDITKSIIDILDIDTDSDYSLFFGVSYLEAKKKQLAFPSQYISVNRLTQEQALFRPLKVEKHANLVIEMFEALTDMHTDHYEVSDDDGINRGFFVANGKKLKDTEVFNLDTSSLLKTSSVMKIMMDNDDFKEYISKVVYFMKNGDNIWVK